MLAGLVAAPSACLTTVLALAVQTAVDPKHASDLAVRGRVVIAGLAAALVIAATAAVVGWRLASSDRWNERQGGELRQRLQRLQAARTAGASRTRSPEGSTGCSASRASAG